MKQNLYRFSEYMRRSGNIEGLFIATEEDVEKIMNTDVYFGEIAGKHSEVIVEINGGNLEMISDEQDKVEWLLKLCGKTVSGINPFDYVDESDLEDEEDIN